MILKRGLRKRCPQCGRGAIYKNFFSSFDSCSHCFLQFVRDPVDMGMFMYVSTAAITGLFVISYFLLGFPHEGWVRLWVFLLGVGVMLITYRLRYCLGIAAIYFADLSLDADTKLDLKLDANS